MIRYGCRNYIGDEDCNKCMARGFMRSCPDHCPDYDSGRKPKSEEEGGKDHGGIRIGVGGGFRLVKVSQG